MTGLQQHRDYVVLMVSTPDGMRTLRAKFIVGCDGGTSQVRDMLGSTLVGSTFAQHWLVVDALVQDHAVKQMISSSINSPALWRPISANTVGRRVPLSPPPGTAAARPTHRPMHAKSSALRMLRTSSTVRIASLCERRSECAAGRMEQHLKEFQMPIEARQP